MRYTIRHPGPVRHVPIGSRVERLAYDALETDVDVPDLTAAEMPLSGGMPGRVARHDGALWVEVSEGRGAFGALDATGLGLLLSDPDREVPLEVDLSPIHVHRPPQRAGGVPPGPPPRGEAIAPGRAGRISEDHREAAVAAIRAYAEGDLRIRDGAAWARLPGPFACHLSHHTNPNFVLTPQPSAVLRFGTADGLLRHDGLAMRRGPNSGLLPRLMQHQVEGTLPDAVDALISIAANRGLTQTVRLIDAAARSSKIPEPLSREVRRALVPLRPFEALASINAVPVESLGEAVEAASTALSRSVGILGGLAPETMVRQAAWYAGRVLPLSAAPVPPDDANALSGLVP